MTMVSIGNVGLLAPEQTLPFGDRLLSSIRQSLCPTPSSSSKCARGGVSIVSDTRAENWFSGSGNMRRIGLKLARVVWSRRQRSSFGADRVFS